MSVQVREIRPAVIGGNWFAALRCFSRSRCLDVWEEAKIVVIGYRDGIKVFCAAGFYKLFRVSASVLWCGWALSLPSAISRCVDLKIAPKKVRAFIFLFAQDPLGTSFV